MAENDQDNEEYKFEGLDSLDNQSMDNAEYDSKSSPKQPGGVEQGTKVRRNALITVGLIVFVMLMYHFVSKMLSDRTTVPSKEDIATPTLVQAPPSPTPAPQPVNTEIPSQPIQAQPTIQPAPVVETNISEVKQKIGSIETNQQNLQSEVSSLSHQISNVSTNIDTLNTQITKLNQIISDLTNQVVKQSEEISVLMERTKPKLIKRRIIRPISENLQILYHINAVIPGRAWLIGTNGSTLTVREGTKVPGYGVVKLIDSMEGRVLTSSGRVIKFSQEDS